MSNTRSIDGDGKTGELALSAGAATITTELELHDAGQGWAVRSGVVGHVGNSSNLRVLGNSLPIYRLSTVTIVFKMDVEPNTGLRPRCGRSQNCQGECNS